MYLIWFTKAIWQGWKEPISGYSGDNIKADTQFLREVKGKNPDEYLSAIDELVTATMVYNPSLYRAFLRKLTNK